MQSLMTKSMRPHKTLSADNEEELSPLSRSPMSQPVYFVDLDDEEEDDTKAKNKEPVEAWFLDRVR